MKKNLFFFLLFIASFSLFAQEGDNRGTIKIKKKGQLVNIQFDDVNYRLIGIDQYGNILDSAVVAFQMNVTIKGIAYSENTIGPSLTYEMQQLLSKCDRTSKIFFENIKAKDKNGTIVKMQRFQYNFGYADENNE